MEATRPDAPRWHVILIGIDRYADGVLPLRGCVNDIDAVQRLLIDRLGVPAASIRRFASPADDGVTRPTDVQTEAPTRDSLLAALRSLGEDVGMADRVFVYYAGHGTQEVDLASDGVRVAREALVPADHDLAAPRLLLDWELNECLKRVAERTPNVCLVLDCCCSAGATRDVPEAGRRERFLPPPKDVTKRTATPQATDRRARGIAAGARGVAADCLVVAACLDDERASESADVAAASDLDRAVHGELTRALLRALGGIEDGALLDLRWSAIWRRVVADVSARNPRQHPWLSGDATRLVFAGPPTGVDAGFAVRQLTTELFELDAGTLSGVTEGALLALYSPDQPARFPPLGSAEEVQARLGHLEVTRATRTSAEARPATKGVALAAPPGARARLVTAGQAARLTVSLDPPDEGLAARLRSSGLLDVQPRGAAGELALLGREGGARELTDDLFGPDRRPDRRRDELTLFTLSRELLERPVPPGRPDPLVALAEQYFAYSAPIRAARLCSDLPGQLEVSLLDCNALTEPVPPSETNTVELPLLEAEQGPEYQLRAGRVDGRSGELLSRGDAYAIQVSNRSLRPLYVTVFLCEGGGRVRLLARRVLVQGEGRARAWFEGELGTPIMAVLDEGVTRSADRVVAIGTTDRAASFDAMAVDSTFDEVAKGIIKRGGAGAFGARDQFTSAQVVLRIEAR